MVPLMPFLFGFTIIESVATSLFTVCLVAAVNTVTYASRRLVRWPVGLFMGIPAAIVALGMGSIAVNVGELYVKIALLVVMSVLAIRTYLKRKLLTDEPTLAMDLKKKVAVVLGGSTSGVVSGFTGVGTGLIIAPIMINYRLVKAQELAPTANLSTMITTLFGAMGYILIQTQDKMYVHFSIGLIIFGAAFISSAYFRPRQHKISGPLKATSLSIILLLMISKVAFSLF